MRWLVRLVVTTAMAVAGAVVAFDSSSLREEKGWKPTPTLVLTAIIVVASGLLWQYIDAEIERRRVRRRTSLANEINKLMFPIWNGVQGSSSNPKTRERIGLHVWMVPTWHWTLIPDALRNLTPRSVRERLPTPRLWRAAQFRLQEDGEPTDILWQRDVGAIGVCWRMRQVQHYVINEVWDDSMYTESAWHLLPEPEQLGLSYEQYQRIWNKYHSVLVWPIFKDPKSPGSRFIGCVVVDALKGYPVDLDRKRVRGKAYKAARSITDRVSPIQN